MEYLNDIFYNHNEKQWILKISFSDNPYKMIKKSKDIIELQKIQNILDNRVNDFFKKKTSILKTSDLGFAYIK